MSITPLGFVFITLGITILMTRPGWLVPLLIVSSCLHSFALVIIGPNCDVEAHIRQECPEVGLGVSPWLFSSFLVFIHLIVLIVRHRRLEYGVFSSVKILSLGWLAFFAWSMSSAFTLPFLFKGMEVNSLANWAGFVAPKSPLAWNFVNAVQATNSGIIGILMLYFLQLTKNESITRRIIFGFILAIFLSFFLSIAQRLEHLKLIPTLDFFTLSQNPSYSVSGMLNGYGGSLIFYRLNWPFSEPSYASVWYASIFVGGLSLFLFSHRILIGFLFFVLGLFGLFNSMGGSGLGGAVVGACILLITALLRGIFITCERKKLFNRLIILVISMIAIVISYEFARLFNDDLINLNRFVFELFYHKIVDGDITRINSNRVAIEIARNTWGLGVGLGSNRASSYILSMLSNVGLPGLILFFILMYYQSKIILRKSINSNYSIGIFILGGSLGCFFGMALGIPDLNFPAWWIWIICGFGFIATEAAKTNINPRTAVN